MSKVSEVYAKWWKTAWTDDDISNAPKLVKAALQELEAEKDREMLDWLTCLQDNHSKGLINLKYKLSCKIQELQKHLNDKM